MCEALERYDLLGRLGDYPGQLQNTMEHRMGSSTGRDVELVGGRVAAGSRGLRSQAEQRESPAMLRH